MISVRDESYGETDKRAIGERGVGGKGIRHGEAETKAGFAASRNEQKPAGRAGKCQFFGD